MLGKIFDEVHNDFLADNRFVKEHKFEKTQDLDPVREMVYSIMMWTTSTYLKEMKKGGSAILHGKVCYYPIDKLRSVIIKNKKRWRILCKVHWNSWPNCISV